MKLSHLSMCIKELELMRWKMICGTKEYKDYEELKEVVFNNKKQKIIKLPVDYYLINEFPFNSAFCYFFRCFQIRGNKIVYIKPPYGKDTHCCLCPMKEQLGLYCAKSPDGEFQSIPFMIEKVESVSIERIMKYLKKIQVIKFTDKLQKICSIWEIHIKHKLGIKDEEEDASQNVE